MNDCRPCEEARAARLGLVLAIKTSEGFAGGAWGLAMKGDIVAVPRSLLEERPEDFAEVFEEEPSAYTGPKTLD